MDRPRWLDVSAAVLGELLGLLHPQERDAAFEELVAKVRAKRAKSRSAVLEPVRVATPARGQTKVGYDGEGVSFSPGGARPIPREEPK